MIGTRLDQVDAPRLLPSKHGWWFIGNGTWTLLRPEQVDAFGRLDEKVEEFLRSRGSFRGRQVDCYSLTVLTTTACNLGCGYCFQNSELDSTGGFRPVRIPRRSLRLDLPDKILDFCERQMKAAGIDSLHLLLFGGEPLLNSRACLDILNRAQRLNVTAAAMATNGTLLTESLARQLYESGLTSAQITFDGCREDHDAIRVRRTGAPTFDAILANLAVAREATALRFHFRINVSHHNAARIDKLFSELSDRLDPDGITLEFAWVGDAGFGYANALDTDDVMSTAFVRWSVSAVEAGFKLTLPSMKTTCQICSTPGGAAGAVVSADGKLYSCWQSAGKAGYDVGTIDAGYAPLDAVVNRWVTCGYEYRQADRATVDEFHDKVDSGVLDYLFESGQL